MGDVLMNHMTERPMGRVTFQKRTLFPYFSLSGHGIYGTPKKFTLYYVVEQQEIILLLMRESANERNKMHVNG